MHDSTTSRFCCCDKLKDHKPCYFYSSIAPWHPKTHPCSNLCQACLYSPAARIEFYPALYVLCANAEDVDTTFGQRCADFSRVDCTAHSLFSKWPKKWCYLHGFPRTYTCMWMCVASERHAISPTNTRRWPNVGLTLAQRLRRWANISPTLGPRLVFSGTVGTAVCH